MERRYGWVSTLEAMTIFSIETFGGDVHIDFFFLKIINSMFEYFLVFL